MTNNSTNPTEPSRETQSLADKPGVTQADVDLAQRIVREWRPSGWPAKEEELSRLLARHREQETARSADVGRPQVFAVAELVAETVAQRCSVGSKRDGSPKAPQRYATIWQAARLGAIEYAKMTQGDRALSTPPADDALTTMQKLGQEFDGEPQYLIRKGGAYYRPNAAGYTMNVAEAGRYTLEEAIQHSHPNGPGGPRDGIDYMLAPPAEPVALDDSKRAQTMERLRILAKQRTSAQMDEDDQEAADWQGAYDWFCDESRAIYAALSGGAE